MSESTDSPVETSSDHEAIRSAWFALAHRLAAAGACLVGLVSLLFDVRVHMACVHGLVVHIFIRVLASAGFWVLQLTLPEPEEADDLAG